MTLQFNVEPFRTKKERKIIISLQQGPWVRVSNRKFFVFSFSFFFFFLVLKRSYALERKEGFLGEGVNRERTP